MRVLQIHIIYVIIFAVKSEPEENKKSKIPLLNFRKHVEESDDIVESNGKNDPHGNNIVEFLMNNVKEVFNGLPEISDPTGISKSNTVIIRPTITLAGEDDVSLRPNFTNDVMLYENLSLNNLIDDRIDAVYNAHTGDFIDSNRRFKLLHLSKEKVSKKSQKTGDNILKLDGTITPEGDKEPGELRRSCISCDNVNTKDCTDPRNKLIPSIVCEREDDLCYSLHTPFGIIDRGCYNVNHNLTTYVCACNLCNFVSISEIPYIFSNKQDWADNVVELSRTRHFRKSVFKDMSCLRCEVNVTTKRGGMLESANCLEGTVGMLPIQECDHDEVCAVRAIKSEGYIWRGCVKSPLYNYWWAFCDSDLCNYDRLISLYDFM